MDGLSIFSETAPDGLQVLGVSSIILLICLTLVIASGVYFGLGLWKGLFVRLDGKLSFFRMLPPYIVSIVFSLVFAVTSLFYFYGEALYTTQAVQQTTIHERYTHLYTTGSIQTLFDKAKTPVSATCYMEAVFEESKLLWEAGKRVAHRGWANRDFTTQPALNIANNFNLIYFGNFSLALKANSQLATMLSSAYKKAGEVMLANQGKIGSGKNIIYGRLGRDVERNYYNRLVGHCIAGKPNVRPIRIRAMNWPVETMPLLVFDRKTEASVMPPSIAGEADKLVQRSVLIGALLLAVGFAAHLAGIRFWIRPQTAASIPRKALAVFLTLPLFLSFLFCAELTALNAPVKITLEQPLLLQQVMRDRISYGLYYGILGHTLPEHEGMIQCLYHANDFYLNTQKSEQIPDKTSLDYVRTIIDYAVSNADRNPLLRVCGEVKLAP